MKEGDYFTEEKLKEEGWIYEYHITRGVHAYKKEEIVIFWCRATHKIESIFPHPKFTYP